MRFFVVGVLTGIVIIPYPSLTILQLFSLFRIEFYHRHLEYYAELDAVLLTGMLEPPEPPNCMSGSNSAVISQCQDQTGLNAICNRMEAFSLVIVPSLKLAPLRQAFTTTDDVKDHINNFERLPVSRINYSTSETCPL